MGITLVVFGLYELSNLLLGKQVIIHCVEQPIENGVLQARVENATGHFTCNPDYKLKVEPNMKLTCKLIWEKCVKLRRATVLEEAVEKCTKEFAYVGPDDINQRPLDIHGEKPIEFLDKVRKRVYTETLGICVLAHATKSDADAESLWRTGSLRFSSMGNQVSLAAVLPMIGSISLAMGLAVILVVSRSKGTQYQEYRLIR